MGLGKTLQGIAEKLEATPNKGKAGLGLGQSHSQEAFVAPTYSSQPDTAILTNDQPALSFEEMEWWRIMEQRKPAKLLRSKFLPQDDILVALRSARESGQTWLTNQRSSSDGKSPDQATTQDERSFHTGGWSSPLIVTAPPASRTDQGTHSSLQALPTSPGATSTSLKDFCLHQGPCVAPEAGNTSHSFWQMASLDRAFDICSSLARAATQAGADSSAATISVLDLSCSDCGATEYMLNYGGVRVQSAQLLAVEAVQKLKDSAGNAGCSLQVLSPFAAEDAKAAMQAVPALAAMGTLIVTTNAALTKTALVDTPGPGLVSPQPPASSAAASKDSSAQRTLPAAAEMAFVASKYSLAAYEGLQLQPVDLVIGTLTPFQGPPTDPKGKSQIAGQGQALETDGKPLPFTGDNSGQLGVMEAEYGQEYRACILWECAAALSCLQPGEQAYGRMHSESLDATLMYILL